MDEARWKRLSRIFNEAQARDLVEREPYLREACADDAALLEEIRGLLTADEGALDALAGAVASSAAGVGDALGRRVGPYRIVRETGSGGMGRVFLAERADGEFDQVVALKIVRSGLASELLLERFRQERQILARLQHPHIARLLDGGVTDDGEPYFALEYVEGEPLDAYCDSRGLGIEERLRLFQDVCRAVAYAHSQLVVHRDLKPDNILATEDGQIRLLDFGIAKMLIDEEQASKGTALLAMTPAYASPEQVRGEPVGTATDVYSLGVILYQLLTGELPYEITGRSPTDVERAVCETEPERPSTRVGRHTGAGGRTTGAHTLDGARLRRRLAGDLDVICMKTLRKEPERRYGSVQALLDDVTRHLEGRPVEARPATVGYRLGKGVRRHRWAVGAAATVLVTSTSLVTFYTMRLAAERDRARVEADKAGAVADFLQGLFEVSDPSESLGETVTARELLDEGAGRIDEGLAGQPEVQATMLRVIGDVYASLGLEERARPLHDRALALSLEVHGATHEDVARARLSLAQTLLDQGDLATAGVQFREAIEAYHRVVEPDDPRLGEAIEQYAYWLETDGRYPEAEEQYRLALDQLRRTVPDDDERVISVVASLGNLLRQVGETDEAETLLREALAQRRALLGSRHPSTLSSARILAALLRDRGAFDESDALYREVLETRREVLGPRHPEVANTLNSHAILLDRMGDHEGAVAAYREFLAVLRDLYSEPHPSVAAAHSNLATSLHTGGRLDEAAEHFLSSIEVQDQVLRPGHPNRAFPLLGLASVYRDQGAPERAEPLIREALVLRRAELAPGHRYIGQTLSELGATLMDLGRDAQAEPLLLEAHAILLEAEGASANGTRSAARRLLALYERAGRAEDAARWRSISGG